MLSLALPEVKVPMTLIVAVYHPGFSRLKNLFDEGAFIALPLAQIEFSW